MVCTARDLVALYEQDERLEHAGVLLSIRHFAVLSDRLRFAAGAELVNPLRGLRLRSVEELQELEGKGADVAHVLAVAVGHLASDLGAARMAARLGHGQELP